MTIIYDPPQSPRASSWTPCLAFPKRVVLVSLFITLLLPVEALEWRRSGTWGMSLLPRAVRSLRSGASSGKDLHVRAVNKTVWIPAKVYRGQNFFDEWEFYSGPDEKQYVNIYDSKMVIDITSYSGLVNYLNKSEAMRAGLAYVTDDGRANIHVDNVTLLSLDEINNRTKLRSSVRISTTSKYNHGLFILDVAQTPFGCGTWPTYLSANENWPIDGKVDIIENVHSAVSNQVSWHTTSNCKLRSPGNFSGTAGSTICNQDRLSNTGCNIVDRSIGSFGPVLNEKGGGVYVMKWDSDSIDVWFFYRSAIPGDILNELPDPATWQTPSASLSGLECPIDAHFRNHRLTFDTTLCGDWAGTSYASSGCPGTCAERVADPTSFVNATWSINYIKIYNKTVISTAYLDAGVIHIWDESRFLRWGMLVMLIMTVYAI